MPIPTEARYEALQDLLVAASMVLDTAEQTDEKADYVLVPREVIGTLREKLSAVPLS